MPLARLAGLVLAVALAAIGVAAPPAAAAGTRVSADFPANVAAAAPSAACPPSSEPVDYAVSPATTAGGSFQRYYDPGTGQFLSVDPLNQGTNSEYTFVGDNPLVGSDPTGQWYSCGTACGGGQQGCANAESCKAPPPSPSDNQVIASSSPPPAPVRQPQSGGGGATSSCSGGGEAPPSATMCLMQHAVSIGPGSVPCGGICQGFVFAGMNIFGDELGVGELFDALRAADAIDAGVTAADAGASSIDALSASGAELDPADAGGQLTRAGRAYAKASEVFGPTSGGPAAINDAGQNALEEILTNPGTREGIMRGGNFAGGLRFVSPDGIGAVFSPDGTFEYFGRMSP